MSVKYKCDFCKEKTRVYNLYQVQLIKCSKGADIENKSFTEIIERKDVCFQCIPKMVIGKRIEY